jgi:hypothetical protein
MMATFEVRMAAADLAALEAALTEYPDQESAAFLLAGETRLPDRTILTVRRLVEIPAHEYRVRNRHRIELSTRAINGLLALCEASGLRPILCHSHPDDVPYSPSDDHGERSIAATAWAFLPGIPVGSLLLTPAGYRGRVWLPGPISSPIRELRVIGRSIRSIALGDWRAAPAVAQEAIHDRQILAFGKPGQALIEATKVCVIGAGGTGSPLAEQLTRLGVSDLVLVDRDSVFDPSNLSRVYGSRFSDAYPPWWRRFDRRRTKLELVAAHLRGINPALRLTAIHGDVTAEPIARQLVDRDVLFICTDNHHWGRAVVNQLAYQYLIPVVNVGVALDGEQGVIRGAVGTVQVLRPGMGCLWCAGSLDSKRIREEALPEAERHRLQAEGYAAGLDDPAPSVVTLTTTTSGLAGTMLLQLVTDFMGPAGEISRLNYLPLEGVVTRGKVLPKAECVCAKYKGRGDLSSLPVTADAGRARAK